MTPWTAAFQAPLSMGFPRQDCWSGLPFPSPGDLPNPGIEPGSIAFQEDSLLSEPQKPHPRGQLISQGMFIMLIEEEFLVLLCFEAFM